MRNPKAIFVGVVFFICIIVGFFSSKEFWDQWGPKSSTSEASESLPNEGVSPLTSFVLIGTDNNLGDPVSLESIWLVQYSQNQLRLEIRPVFPKAAAPSFNSKVAACFHLDENLNISNSLWPVLESDGVKNTNYILIDRIALEQLIRSLGGISYNNQKSFGFEDFGTFESWIENPIEAQADQQALYQGLCQAISELKGQSESGSFGFDGLMPEHIDTNMNQIKLRNDWSTFIAAGAWFDCNFQSE